MGKVDRGRWVECFLVIFLVVEVLTSPNGGAFFWPQRYPRLVSSKSPLFVRASSSRWVQGLRGRRLASLLSLWLRSVRPFFISLLLVEEDCICQGVFLMSRFLLTLGGMLWASLGITLGWRRYCDSVFSYPLVWFRASSGRVFTFHSCYSRSFRGVFSWIMEPLFT